MNMQTNDDRLTFLLPRPAWVNDMDVHCCSSCNSVFGPLKRRHHCRNCGNIFCHECSARSVPLPQLGYGTKPVRVCNSCFDVAYLVTYAIDEDHGLSTQMHGVRGLLELTEKDNEKDLHNMVAYGGVDALIWLCRSSKSIRLHHLTTTILAMLAEKESIRPVIITKWALPPLLFLVRFYTTDHKKSPANSIHSSITPTLTNNNIPSDTTQTSESRQSIVLEIVINCTHILYQLSRAGILSQKELVSDGVFDTLLNLAGFHIQNLQYEKGVVEGSPIPTNSDDEQQLHERVNIIQSLAAKAISAISSLVSFQPTMIELIEGTDRLSSLLRSQNAEVRKYVAKTIAYLSLRNDKYKPTLLYGDGSKALVSILAVLPQEIDTKELTSGDTKSPEHQQGLNSAAVSHACCALANFATNHESQVNLMSQPNLLKYLCNVPIVFCTHTEIYRHVARSLANLALYEENVHVMLGRKKDTDKEKDSFLVLPVLLFMGKASGSDVQRHIVRALDNLSSNAEKLNLDQWQLLFHDAFSYIRNLLVDESRPEKDVDTMKRAKSIISRDNNDQHIAVEQNTTTFLDTEEQEEKLPIANTPSASGAEEEQEEGTGESEEVTVNNSNQQKQSKKKKRSKNIK